MLLSRPGLSREMVGRRDELGALHRLVARAYDEQEPASALLIGEAGVGKTRLLRELIDTAPAGTVVLASHAEEGDLERPHALIREAAQDALQTWEPLPGQLSSYEHALSHLLSPALSTFDHPADGHQHGGDELLRAAVALVRHVVGGGPAVIAFDDLHWADSESIELFRRLATARGLPAAVIGSFRPEDYRPDHPLAGMLDALARQRETVEITLRNLSRDELGELLARVRDAPVPAAVADALFDRTLGNPFFAEELLEAAEAQAGPAVWEEADALNTAALPWTAQEAVRHRLRSVPPDDRRAAEVAAVLGRRFPFELLVEVLGRGEEHALAACRRLVTTGVLVEEGSDGFSFRHALTREAMVAGLLSIDRRRIHAQALDVLERDADASPTLLASHALGAHDDTRASRYGGLAARTALEEGAPREALRYAEIGLSTHPDEGLHAVAARAAANIGRLEEAERHARMWAERADESAAVCEALCLETWLRWSRGDTTGAWARVDHALTVAERCQDPGTLARVAAVRAQLHLITGQDEDALDWSDRAIGLAERVDLPEIHAHALVTKATALADLGTEGDGQEVVPEARELMDEALGLARSIGHVETLTRAYNNLLLVGQGLATVAESRPLLDEARQLADRYGLERFAYKVATLDANLALIEGNREAFAAAVAECKRWTAIPIDRVWCATFEAMLLLEDGDAHGARAVLDDYADTVAEIQDAQAELDYASAEAALAAATRDKALGMAALRRACRAVPEVNNLVGSVWWMVALFALDAGVSAVAVIEALERCQPPRGRRHRGITRHVEALLEAAAGRRDAAVDALREALQEPQGWRPAFLVADINRRLAELLARGGRQEEAVSHARLAVQRLREWPGPRLDQARRLEAELRAGDTAAGALTAREREVLELIVEGLSNREIAEELVIARKTAATHVSNILRKLGVKSRTQAAAWAVESGLAGGTRPRRAAARP